jgi:hypothetical protein
MFDGMRYRWQLRRLEGEVDRIRTDYAKHQKGLSGNELEHLYAEESSMLEPVLAEIDTLKTQRFCRTANRLMVPSPDWQDKELWEELRYGRGKVLTCKGIWELKKLIRQERRERREAFLVWLAALTGIVGALTGLAAVLIR